MQGVITLWYGNILFQDAALQLLQLVETVCEWGRDVYRQGVLNCLAGGRESLREITPAWSQAWSTRSDEEDVLIGNNDSEDGDRETEGENDVLAQTSSLRGLVLEQSPGLAPIGISQDQMLSGSKGNSEYDCDMPDMGESQHLSSTKSAPVPPVAMIALDRGWPYTVWTENSLPEKTCDMEDLLRRIYPREPLQRAAALLLHLVSGEDTSICTTRLAISRHLGDSAQTSVEHYTDAPDCTEEDADKLQLPLRAVVVLQSTFSRPEPALDYRIDCMICTQEAAYVLAEIAAAGMPALQWIRYWDSHDCDCLTAAISSVSGRSARQAVADRLSHRWSVLNSNTQTLGNAHLSWRSCVCCSEMLDTIDRVESSLSSAGHPSASVIIQVSSQGRHAISGLSEAQQELAELRDIPGCLIEAPTEEPYTPTCFVPFEDVVFDEVRPCLKTFQIPRCRSRCA